MKFTEDEAFDELKKQLKRIVGDPAINDREIREQIANLLPHVANDDTELAQFASLMLPVLKSSDGGARKYASNAVKKKEKEIEEGKANKTADPPAEPTPDDALLKRLEKLEQEIANRDKELKKRDKMSEITRHLEAKGVSDKEWINDFLSEVNVSEDVDAETAADRYLKIYNKTRSQTPPAVTPQGAQGTAAQTAGKKLSDVSEYMKKRREELEKANVNIN